MCFLHWPQCILQTNKVWFVWKHINLKPHMNLCTVSECQWISAQAPCCCLNQVPCIWTREMKVTALCGFLITWCCILVLSMQKSAQQPWHTVWYPPGSEQTPHFQVSGIRFQFPHDMCSLLPLQLKTILNGKSMCKKISSSSSKEGKGGNHRAAVL